MISYKKYIFLLFAVVALFDLIGVVLHIKPIHFLFKPLLMPVLILAIVTQGSYRPGRDLMMAALFFSFIGDVLLLFADNEQVYFILGLCAFLLTHIFYIIYFIRENKPGRSLVKKHKYVPLLILLYIVSLLYLLLPRLGELKVPVVVYAVIIASMLFFSLNLSYAVNKRSRQFFARGSICFIVSDSILAIDKFYYSIPMANVLLMLTYCLAQYLIVKGFLNRRN